MRVNSLVTSSATAWRGAVDERRLWWRVSEFPDLEPGTGGWELPLRHSLVTSSATAWRGAVDVRRLWWRVSEFPDLEPGTGGWELPLRHSLVTSSATAWRGAVDVRRLWWRVSEFPDLEPGNWRLGTSPSTQPRYLVCYGWEGSSRCEEAVVERFGVSRSGIWELAAGNFPFDEPRDLVCYGRVVMSPSRAAQALMSSRRMAAAMRAGKRSGVQAKLGTPRVASLAARASS